MASLNNKLLSLSLALLLGLMPFARPLADMSSMHLAHAASAMPAAHLMQHTQMSANTDDNPCKGCTTAHGCNSSGCACYQCGSCGASVLHAVLKVHFASLSAPLPLNESSQLAHHPFLLFRPPRA